MAPVSANALLVVTQLSLLLLISVSSVADQAPAEAPSHHHRHHGHPPTPPPAHPPVHPPTPSTPPATPPSLPPTKPPASPPVKPPSSPPTAPRKYVAVQGVVYCKSCKYRGVDTLMGASPLSGASVKLQCNNTKVGLTEQTKTDKNGYFFFMPQKLTTSGSHKCKVYIVSSSLPACNVTTDLHGGASGAILVPSKNAPGDKAKPLPFVLFTVGPFAFEPHKKLPCHY